MTKDELPGPAPLLEAFVKVGSRSFAVLLMAALILPITVAYAVADRAHTRARIDQSLRGKVTVETHALQDYFERARAITLLSSHNPAFRDFYERPRSRASHIRSERGSGEINAALSYLERLYPSSIGEACFIDRSGAENARVVRGHVAPLRDLSPDESGNSFFAPTFRLHQGGVYQASPYISPDTGEWVISNSALVPTRDGRKHAFVHFEITVESFRSAAAHAAGDSEIDVVDSTSGSVLLSSDLRQKVHAPLGEPADHQFANFVRGSAPASGLVQWNNERVAYERVPTGPDNANHLIVFASRDVEGGLLGEYSLLSLLLCIFALGLFTTALLSFRSSHQDLEEAVLTDGLTGLGSRRSLLADIDAAMASSTLEEPTILILGDLDGFKTYNDTFGHPAGDHLLTSLGTKLNAALNGIGTAYRMGGDEFCALIRLGDRDAVMMMNLVTSALSEEGDAFSIKCSRGSVLIPTETRDVSEAMRIADRRMYQHKNNARASAGHQSAGVLLQALRETDSLLGDHVSVVARRAERLGDSLGLNDTALRELRQAAQLHDIGKIAIPEAILNKPGRLDKQEWAFMQTHTVVGERIIGAAPALAEVGKLVRSSHERFDGTGYPDQLAGDAIPLGSRIIFICDAFDAITSNRSYQLAKDLPDALAEMQRCSGSQFDPELLRIFCEVMQRPEQVPILPVG
jgi:diguanylate cyclase (GGDEF)-like protein